MLHKATYRCPCGNHVLSVYIEDGEIYDVVWDEKEVKNDRTI